MVSLRIIICLIKKHNWKNDNSHPVHGYEDAPYPDSYCSRCFLTGDEYYA